MKAEGVPPGGLTAAQALSDLWDEHVRSEFATKDARAAVETMVPDAYVNHVPRVESAQALPSSPSVTASCSASTSTGSGVGARAARASRFGHASHCGSGQRQKVADHTLPSTN
jgi:hypothetical protein